MTLTAFLNQTVGGIFGRGARASDPASISQVDLTRLPPDVRRLIRDGRYCRVLAPEQDLSFDSESLLCAQDWLRQAMALVPAGEACLVNDVAASISGGLEFVTYGYRCVPVPAIMIDRLAVTNDAYSVFVNSGGYEASEYWPSEILASVFQFVDRSGRPGPRDWQNGRPPAHRAMHPVVGVCWYEAQAYAKWAGKVLPTAAQWQRAGTWAKSYVGDGLESRYPWGNAFDPQRANLRSSGHHDTLPVDALPEGQTPNGVRQLIGNVWEWMATPYQPSGYEGAEIHLDRPMAEIRGGAFDTYFHSHATCQFRTGQPLFYRGPNVGFRCCISADRILPADPVEESL